MNRLNFDDLESGLQIDPDDLDNMVINHPQLYYFVCCGYTGAISSRDEAKDLLKQQDAELSFTVRQRLEEEGKRPTESQVAAAIETHDDHHAALSAYRARCVEADNWGNLKAAYEQRSYALREIVELHIANYSATATISGPVNTAMTARTDVVRKAVAEKRRESQASDSPERKKRLTMRKKRLDAGV